MGMNILTIKTMVNVCLNGLLIKKIMEDGKIENKIENEKDILNESPEKVILEK